MPFGFSREPHVVDELTTAQRLHLNMWTGFAVLFGALLGVRVAQTGVNPAVAIIGCALGFPAFVRLLMWLILSGSGGIARQFYNPAGGGTPSRSAYSGPESLAVRGRFEEAIAAYEQAAAEEPDDPEPWLRISRIEKSDLRRPRRALEALREARTRTVPGSPTAMLIGRQMVELYLGDLNEPPRAMPELARLIEGFGATPTGAWARREMAELKTRVAAGEFGSWVTQPAAHRIPGAPADDPPDSPPAPDAPESPELPATDPATERPAPEREVPERPAPEREAPGPEGPGAPPLPPGPDGPVPDAR